MVNEIALSIGGAWQVFLPSELREVIRSNKTGPADKGILMALLYNLSLNNTVDVAGHGEEDAEDNESDECSTEEFVYKFTSSDDLASVKCGAELGCALAASGSSFKMLHKLGKKEKIKIRELFKFSHEKKVCS